MMKKIFLICICSGFICFLCVACRDRDVAKSFPEDISGTAVSGNYPIVVDETGKKRELKLGDVDTEDKGEDFVSFCDMDEYFQMEKGHYFYLENSSDDGTYTICRDKGQEVGKFTLSGESYGYYISEFIKLGKDYYAVLTDYSDDEDYECQYQFVRVDTKEERTEIIDETEEENPIVDMVWYKDAFYYKSDIVGVSGEASAAVKRLNAVNGESQEIFHLHGEETNSRLLFLDGKIYYGVQSWNRIFLYSYDLESGQKREVFQYERKGSYTQDRMLSNVLEIDKDYIYISNEMIPRAGGEIMQIGGRRVGFQGSIVHNDKYVFYCDEDCRLHRMDKKTGKDTVIQGIRAMDVKCADDSIYVLEYDKFYDSNDSEEMADEEVETSYGFLGGSFNLYSMDLDGKCKKRLMKGSNGKLLVSEK